MRKRMKCIVAVVLAVLCMGECSQTGSKRNALPMGAAENVTHDRRISVS